MPEFRVVLDGLDLNEEDHAFVAQAVLTAGLKAVGRLRRDNTGEFAAISAPAQGLPDWIINGGWVIRDAYAQKAREILVDQGVLTKELGGPLGG